LLTNNGGNDNESILRKHRIHFPINISSATVVDTFGNVGELPLNNVVVVNIENEISDATNSYSLEQNYPNPFNPSTKIRFSIPASPLNPFPYQGEGNRERYVNLKVFDILGNEVTALVDEYKPAGSYEVVFNANAGTRNLASGIYFYQLIVNDPSTSSGQSFIQLKKMILLK
jgi:hypothetical protein